MRRLSRTEIRARAAVFAKDWRAASYEKGETRRFYSEFFGLFGVRRRVIARFEQHGAQLDNRAGVTDLFWPGVLLVEQKRTGRDPGQTREYVDALPELVKPRHVLVSDFQSFELYDLGERVRIAFPLSELPDHVQAFGFVNGWQRRNFRDQVLANIEAAELVGRLHDALADTGYRGRDLERFMVRLVFCLFADHTGIFGTRSSLLDLIETRTSERGTKVGPLLSHLFQVLDTPDSRRSSVLAKDLAQFPHINGELFQGLQRFPSFDSGMRQLVLDACHFDWSRISPTIFGSLFQSATEAKQRRAQGAHYTTEKNILKVIEPLFLDELRSECQQLKMRKRARLAGLRRFRKKLGSMRFLDPACGCGNFLVVAYRELRLLEIEVIRELRSGGDGPGPVDSEASCVNVDQFYGVEIRDFPVRVTKAALWMMDHIMNGVLSAEIGHAYVRSPLRESPRITCGDALETDWADLLPPEDCTVVFGNPPFVGAAQQSPEQRIQVRRIADLGRSGEMLDYAAAWFIKAAEYARGTDVRIGFVAGNSITHGEQVNQLWPVLFERHGLEIAFGHRTFGWGSDTRGKAHTDAVIVGLENQEHARREKRLFTYPDLNGEPVESSHTVLSPYLCDAGGLREPTLTVAEDSAPMNGMKKLRMGAKPADGGHYIFTSREREAFLELEPGAEEFIRPYVGIREFLRGAKRWILALQDASPEQLAKMPHVRKRIIAVRSHRTDSKSRLTQALALTPRRYHINVTPAAPYLIVPKTTSVRRDYVPVGWVCPPAIPGSAVFVLEEATLADFALLSSAMHMAWLRHVGGRLGSRYGYSMGGVYNTFPTPPGFATRAESLTELDKCAQAVLRARSVHQDATLAELYASDFMPANLRRAHQKLDRAVDRLYRRKHFDSEIERIAHLLICYEKMLWPFYGHAA